MVRTKASNAAPAATRKGETLQNTSFSEMYAQTARSRGGSSTAEDGECTSASVLPLIWRREVEEREVSHRREPGEAVADARLAERNWG